MFTEMTQKNENRVFEKLDAIWLDKKDVEHDRVYVVKSLFVFEGKFGKCAGACVVGIDGKYYNINLPKYIIETVENILADTTKVDAIKSGLMGIEFLEYHNKKFNKTCTKVLFHDIF